MYEYWDAKTRYEGDLDDMKPEHDHSINFEVYNSDYPLSVAEMGGLFSVLGLFGFIFYKS